MGAGTMSGELLADDQVFSAPEQSDSEVFAPPAVPAGAVVGWHTTIETLDGGEIAGRFVVMNAPDVIASHDVNLRTRQQHADAIESAPRDRAELEQRVSQVAQGLDPAKLGDSLTSDEGAPVVGADGMVEAGNVRAIALQRIQRVPGEKAQAYRDWLMANALAFGIDPEQLAAVDKPMLVRVPSSPGERGGQPEPASEVARDAPADDQAPPEWMAFSPETETLGVPRAEMPQIKAEHRGALTQFLLARGIQHEQAEVLADELKPSQAEWAPGKVAKAVDYQGGNRAVLVSSDGHVLDGHHQWLASLAKDEPLRVIRFDAPISVLIEQARAFPSAEQAPSAEQPAQQV
jgi:hypothetical protein